MNATPSTHNENAHAASTRHVVIPLPTERTFLKRSRPIALSAVLREQARRSLLTWVVKARAVFGRDFPMPSVAFDLIGEAAGYADTQRQHIRLNATLLAENPVQFDSSVIPHELAHLITGHLYPHPLVVSPHGPEWQSVMLRLGVLPVRTHNLNTDRARALAGTQHKGFSCGCGPRRLSSTLRNRWLSGQEYVCDTCRLTLVGDAAETAARMTARAEN